jgi:hypothetical protein
MLLSRDGTRHANRAQKAARRHQLAHADEPEHPAEGEVKWLSFVTGYLRPAIQYGGLDLWLDRLVPGGIEWAVAIEEKLRACDIFVLLVSRHSLSSPSVEQEIAIVRERQAKGEAVHFYPLVLTPTPKVLLDLVRDKNLRPLDGKSLSQYSGHEREMHMAEIANEIAGIAKGAAETKDKDKKWLEAWLEGRGREVAIAISARAALRVAPIAVRDCKSRGFQDLVSAVFRANASARVAGKHPRRVDQLRQHTAGAAAAAAATALEVPDPGYDPLRNYVPFEYADAQAARHVAAAAAYACIGDTSAADEAANAAGYAAAADDNYPMHDARSAHEMAAASMWLEIRSDAALFERANASAISDLPLWLRVGPDWAQNARTAFQTALPKGEDWDVWIDWYEQRLRGGSRGEDYELVFASVPVEEWDKGPAAANAWIRAHLPQSEPGDFKELADGLKQQAALYTFRLSDGRIAVAPEEARPDDREATGDFLGESQRKAGELRERLVRVQADTRLQRTLALLDERLAPPIESIRIGLVLSSLRSLESDARAYDTEEGRKEHAVDLISALGDLAGTVRDFASQFPRSRDIVANQIALELVEEPRALDAALQASESLAVAAESHLELIDRDTPEALREPKESAEGARTTADRAKHVGLRLLTAANFGRIVAQTREMAVESWRDVRKQVPKAAGKAAANALVAGPALAFGLWAGHDGLTMLLDAAGAIAAINGAVGHPGGAFDRLLKTIERVAAKKPAAETQDPDPPEVEEESPRPKAKKKTAVKGTAAKQKPTRRAQEKPEG